MRTGVGAALALVLLQASAAWAGTPTPVKMKCPVGGKRFTHIETMSYTTWGERPDGKPFGSWRFPMPLPVCPDNGLVIYKSFSKAEIARLSVLIASPEYRELVARDTPYYRAAWLFRAMEPAADDTPLWLVLYASWEADDAAELKARYQREFADGAARTPPRPDDIEWIALQGRSANAMRELARFDEAQAALRAIPRGALEVSEPPAADDGDLTEAEREAAEAAEVRQGWSRYLARLEVLVQRRDPSSEPLDAIPPTEAAGRCRDLQKAGAADPTGACASDAVREVLAAMADSGP